MSIYGDEEDVRRWLSKVMEIFSVLRSMCWCVTFNVLLEREHLMQ